MCAAQAGRRVHPPALSVAAMRSRGRDIPHLTANHTTALIIPTMTKLVRTSSHNARASDDATWRSSQNRTSGRLANAVPSAEIRSPTASTAADRPPRNRVRVSGSSAGSVATINRSRSTSSARAFSSSSVAIRSWTCCVSTSATGAAASASGSDAAASSAAGSVSPPVCSDPGCPAGSVASCANATAPSQSRAAEKTINTRRAEKRKRGSGIMSADRQIRLRAHNA